MPKNDRVITNQSGLALVLTLLAISFLVAVTVQLMVTIDRQVSVSTAQSEQVRLDSMVLAGLNLARVALLADQQDKDNKFDSPQDRWATFDQEKIKELTKEVDLKVTVTDLSGRLQVNALGNADNKKYREVWLRFLLSGKFAIKDEDQAEALLDALGDWVDKDEEERSQGAEDLYYRSLVPPYSCRNGKMLYLEEMLLVKGMTPKIVYGDKEYDGIINYVTVLGDDGKINLNTAPLPVLQALSPDMTSNLAQELIDFREDKQHQKALATVDWYRQVSGFPITINFANDLLKVVSSDFNISVSATIHQYSRTGTGILHRAENQEQSLLLWKIE